jgi:hypothetical protein
MMAAALRFPQSIRHDLIIPGLVIVGLWIVAAWFYAENTYPGGAIAYPQEVLAAVRHAPCFAEQPSISQSNGWQVRRLGHVWYAHNRFREYPWSKADADASVSFDARTGKMIQCQFGVID